ncbi:fimbrial biogenesis chaperone [Providencia stuartii]|uniref:fimbrial biogenesis chaperone n=1 Tax=Providencia stuartii TaxID=588 RepID=UPI0038BE3CD4
MNIKINNDESTPSLIQSWIDTGDASVAPDSVNVPFIITPLIFRIEPHTGQTLRIMYTGEALPNDRESIFWLNILDISAKPKFENKNNLNVKSNYLQLPIHSRIKLFCRPEKLTRSLSEAYNSVIWHIEKQGAKAFLCADNQSPYFITYNHITLIQSNYSQSINPVDMVAPYSSIRLPIHGNMSGYGKVKWTVVNDYGGHELSESALK